MGLSEVDKVCGLSVNQLAEIKKKLAVLGLDLIDMIEFLDRDRVQLFAEQQTKIKRLESKLNKIAAISNEIA